MPGRPILGATSVAALILLAACNGTSDGSPTTLGSTGGSGGLGKLAGLFDPGSDGGSISGLPTGAGPEFTARIQEISDITSVFNSGVPTTPPTTLPPGSATFSGAGVIVDVNIPEDVDTLPEIDRYAVLATDATASVNFDTGAFTARQENFVDIADNPVAGQIDYAGTISSSSGGFGAGTATGSVAGTSISDSAAALGYFDSTPETVFGAFTAIGSGGIYPGVEFGGGFFAERN